MKQPSYLTEHAGQAATGSEARHTPGPWRWYDDTDAAGKNNRHEIVALGKTICHIYTSVPHQDSANARLIAAAPDLLSALVALVDSLASADEEGLIEHAPQMEAARAAIRAATGTPT